MKQPTYKEQHDKIVSAYMKDKLDPLNSCACFIGNLLNGKAEWAWIRTWKDNLPVVNHPLHRFFLSGIRCIFAESNELYSVENIIALERNFLKTLYPKGINLAGTFDEDKLFEAMDTTLEMLKQIHISKGEKVEEIEFVKRELV